MRKRLFISLVMAVLALQCLPAFAAGGGNGNGNGNSGGNSSENSSAGSEDGNKGNGQGNGNSGSGGKPDTVGKDGSASLDVSPDSLPNAEALPATDPEAAEALRQVLEAGGLGLDRLLDAVAKISTGRMLEVNVVRLSGRIAYDVIVLEAGGKVRRVRIDARTGRQIMVTE